MKKTLGLSAAALVTMASLAGCGSGDDYCDTYDKAKQEINGLDFSKMDDFDQVQDYTKRLRDSAPNDKVENAWNEYDKAFSGIRKALDDNDMSLKDFKKLQDVSNAGDLPDDVSQKQALDVVKQLTTVTKKYNLEDAQKTTKKYSKKHCESKS